MKASVYNLPHFRVDYQDWFRGNNVADNYPNGGLLASEAGFNPFKYEGLLVPQRDFPSSSVTASLKRAASVAIGINTNQNTGKFELLGIGTDFDPNTWGVGRFYTIDPDTGAMVILGSTDTTRDYRRGWSDMCSIGYDTLISSDQNITKVVVGTISTISETWGTSNGMSGVHSDTVPHPMVTVDSFAYIADGDSLTQVDLGAGTATRGYFTHIPGGYVVTAMIYHRGYVYMAAAYWYVDLGLVTNAKTHTRIFLWDGFSQSFADDFYIDDTVTAMRRGGDGTVFVWTTKHFGYLNGTQFVKLRKITSNVYKCDIVDVPNGVMYAHGTEIIRYSSVVPGGKRAFYRLPFTPVTPDTTAAFTANSFQHTTITFTTNARIATQKNTLQSGTCAGFGIVNGSAITYTSGSHDNYVSGTTYYAGTVGTNDFQVFSDAGLTTLVTIAVDTDGYPWSMSGGTPYVQMSSNPAIYGIVNGSAITYTGSTSGGLVHNTVYYVGSLSGNQFRLYNDAGLTTPTTITGDVSSAAFTIPVSGSETIIGLGQLKEDYPIVLTDHGTPGNGRNLLYGPLDNGTSGNNKTLRYNRRITRVPVKVRGVVIETEGLGASGTITVSYYNSEGVLKPCGTYTYAIAAHAARQRWAFEVTGHPTTTEIDPVITISGTAKFKSVDFYYERSENDSNT